MIRGPGSWLNLDVITSADWIGDLGPEGGDEGSAIVAVGTPEDLAAQAALLHTGAFLGRVLGGGIAVSA